MKFTKDTHGVQQMNPTGFGEPPTLHQAALAGSNLHLFSETIC